MMVIDYITMITNFTVNSHRKKILKCSLNLKNVLIMSLGHIPFTEQVTNTFVVNL